VFSHLPLCHSFSFLSRELGKIAGENENLLGPIVPAFAQ
jgi:hypothetical protein